jgi:hypothetical protein
MAEDMRSKCPRCGYEVIIRMGHIQCMASCCEYNEPIKPVSEMVDSRNLGGPLFVPPTTRKPYPGERT